MKNKFQVYFYHRHNTRKEAICGYVICFVSHLTGDLEVCCSVKSVISLRKLEAMTFLICADILNILDISEVL
jgi:hypothetical protein